MKAMLTTPEQTLVWHEVEDLVLKEGEVRIKVACAAINRADIMQRHGDYPPPEGCPEWVGLEVAGTIVEMSATAKENSGFRIGDKVAALLGGGGYAEYVTVPYGMVMPVPKGRTLAQASAMPEAYCTAYLNLFYEGKAKAGDTLLMHAGASGLASVVIPMAKAFGLRVITTVLSDEIAERIKPLGADLIVNTSKEDIAQVLKKQLEEGHPVDVAIDCLGGSFMGGCLPYLAHGARWIMIAALAGQKTEIDLKNIYVRNVRIIGSTLRSKTPAFKADLIRELVREVWPKVEAGLMKPSIYKILPMQEANEGHAILERGENVGKVVLTLE